jgi:hypothetical protein
MMAQLGDCRRHATKVPRASNEWMTAELSVNEALLASTNNGRFVVGFAFGRWACPRDLSNHQTPLGTDVPRVRYVIFP